MGITRASYPSKIRFRSSKRHTQYSFKPTHKHRYRATIIDNYQDIMEDKLINLYEAIGRTCSYLRSVRHEYEGNAREAVEYYFDSAVELYKRIQSYYASIFIEGGFIFQSDFEVYQDNYDILLTDAGITEDEIIDYIFGNIREKDSECSEGSYESQQSHVYYNFNHDPNDINIDLDKLTIHS
jgi:hypothetical protein